jgi:hypothetical protein
MKHLVATASLFALALTAWAQNTGEQQVVVPASKAVQRSYMPADDFARYKGAYELSNGKTLYLVRKATRIYAMVDQQTMHEITRTARDTFHALDGTMSMNVVRDDDDTVSGHLSYIDEAPAVAGLPPQSTRVEVALR